jgi:hypothetical protein
MSRGVCGFNGGDGPVTDAADRCGSRSSPIGAAVIKMDENYTAFVLNVAKVDRPFPFLFFDVWVAFTVDCISVGVDSGART